MKKITLLLFTVLAVCWYSNAQFSFPTITGPTNVAEGSPVTLLINNAGNVEGVPAGSYTTFTITADWANGFNAYSIEADLRVTTSAGNVTIDPPTSGGLNNFNSTSLTFSGTLPGGPYNPGLNGLLEIRLNQSFSGSDANWSNIVVTLIPDPSYVECSGPGINDGFCYGNNETFTLNYNASDPSNQLAISFNAGSLEEQGTGTFDDLIIYDGTDNTGIVLFDSDINGGGDLTGLSFIAASGNLFLAFDSDFSVSCVNGDETPINFDVTCVPCDVFTAPFFEGFESGVPPSCWASYRGSNNQGAVYDWTTSATSFTGSSAAYVRYENAGVETEDWLVTPLISLSATTNNVLTFQTRDEDAPNYGATYTILVSLTSQTDRNSFIPIQSYNEPELGNTYNQKTIDLSGYDGLDIYIAFVLTQNFSDSWFIDDVSIDGLITYTYDNGWIPSSPVGVSTVANDIIVENGNAIFDSGTTNSQSITINPAGAITVDVGATLSSANGMTLESVSNQYSSLIVDGTILGTVNYNRHINDFQSTPGATTGQNDLISPPLTDASQTFGDFKAINTNIPTGTIGGVPSWLFGPFNNSTNAYVNWTAANDGNTLIPGVGYRTASLTSTPDDTFVFTGDVQSGSVTVGISVTSESRWNLIGNPYPSYLSADDFLNLTSNNSLLDDNAVAIYGYDGTAQNGWDVINFNTTSGYNMAPGQGFLVAAKTGGSITFNEAMRRNTGSDDFIPLRNAVNPMVKLQMTSATNSYHTDFYFNDSSTTGLDRGYDAALFDSYLPDFYIYSHLVDDNQGRAMSIQSLGTTDLSDVTVPLGLKVSQGQQVTISIEESTLPTNVLVYLEDNLTNTFTLLNTGDYTFTASTNISGTGRFFLRYNEDTLSSGEQNLNALQIYTTKSPSELIINGQLFGKSTLALYDIQGRLVLETTLNEGETSQRIDVSHLNAGVYVANVSNNTQQKTQKVIIR